MAVYTTLHDAYVCSVRDIIWNHKDVTSEDGELTYEQLFVDYVVEQPNRDIDGLIQVSPYGIQYLDAYAGEIVEGIKADFDYTYYERLREHSAYDFDGEIVVIFYGFHLY